MSEEENEYEVESIQESRLTKRRRKVVWEYRVRWKGYSPNDDTWEPISSFKDSESIVERFWERANTNGRDYRDVKLFKVGETCIPTGPPRHKPKLKTPRKSDSHQVAESSQNALNSKPREESPREKRGRSIEGDGEQHDQPSTKRARNQPSVTKTPHKASATTTKSKSPLSAPTTPARRPSPPKKRAPSPQIIPDSDDESQNDLQQEVPDSPPLAPPPPEPLAEDESPLKVVPTASSTPADGPQNPTTPFHRTRAAEPRVKLVNEHYGGKLEGAISAKARLTARMEPIGLDPRTPNVGSTAKPGPGRSSAGLKRNGGSLLTFQKGELVTVKRQSGGAKKLKAEQGAGARKVLGRVASASSLGEQGASMDVEEDLNLVSSLEDADNLTVQPGNDLLTLTGIDEFDHLPDFAESSQQQLLLPLQASQQQFIDNAELPPLPDFEEPLPSPSAMVTQSTISDSTSTQTLFQRSLTAAKNTLFPDKQPSSPKIITKSWPKPTIFGPLGFGSSSNSPNDEQSANESLSPFVLRVDTSVFVPLVFVNPTTPVGGSRPLRYVPAMDSSRPPAKFYGEESASQMLNILRAEGTYAKVLLANDATEEDKTNFSQIQERLRANSIGILAAGMDVLVLCAPCSAMIPQRLNIPASLLGDGTTDIFVSRVTVQNRSEYSRVACFADQW